MFRKFVFIAVVMMLNAGPLMAAEPASQFETVSNDDLADVRGGFNLNGMDLSFGAEVRTYLGGELVLQTNFHWNSEGMSRSEYVSSSLSQPDASQLAAGMIGGHGIYFPLSGHRVFLANDGQTALMHRTDGAIQNILMNTASGVIARQEMDATIDLHNAGSFLTLVRDVRIGDALNSAMANAVPRM